MNPGIPGGIYSAVPSTTNNAPMAATARDATGCA